MLKRFKVKNFKGFKNEIELDLTNNGNYDWLTNSIYNNINKLNIIYDGEVNGKSSLIDGLCDIKNMVHKNAFHIGLNQFSQYYNNYFNSFNTHVRFEYEFIFDDDIVIYKYSKQRNGRLYSEKIMVNGEVIAIHHSNEYMGETKVEDRVIPRDTWRRYSSILSYIKLNPTITSYCYIINKLLDFINGIVRVRYPKDFNNPNSIFHKFFKTQSNWDGFHKWIENNNFNLEYTKHFRMFMDNPSKRERGLMVSYYIESLYNHKRTRNNLILIDDYDFYKTEILINILDKPTQIIMSSNNTHKMSESILRPDNFHIINKDRIENLKQIVYPKELRQIHNLEKIYYNLYKI